MTQYPENCYVRLRIFADSVLIGNAFFVDLQEWLKFRRNRINRRLVPQVEEHRLLPRPEPELHEHLAPDGHAFLPRLSRRA